MGSSNVVHLFLQPKGKIRNYCDQSNILVKPEKEQLEKKIKTGEIEGKMNELPY